MRRVSRISGRRRSDRLSRPRPLRLRRHLDGRLVLRRRQGRHGPRHRVRRRRQGRPVLQRRRVRGPGEGGEGVRVQDRGLEPTEGETDADKEQRLASLAKQGYNPVVGVGYAYATAVKAAAEQFPDTTFGIVDDSTVQAGQRRGPGLLRGAGLLPRRCRRGQEHQDDVVGFVGGVDIPLIHKFQAGFEQGVKDTNPKVKVLTPVPHPDGGGGWLLQPRQGQERPPRARSRRRPTSCTRPPVCPVRV